LQNLSMNIGRKTNKYYFIYIIYLLYYWPAVQN